MRRYDVTHSTKNLAGEIVEVETFRLVPEEQIQTLVDQIESIGEGNYAGYKESSQENGRIHLQRGDRETEVGQDTVTIFTIKGAGMYKVDFGSLDGKLHIEVTKTGEGGVEITRGPGKKISIR